VTERAPTDCTRSSLLVAPSASLSSHCSLTSSSGMTRFSFAAVVAVVLAAPSCLQSVVARPAWGAMGHYMTAAIAQGFLTPAARDACAAILPEVDGDIGLIARYAACRHVLTM
jgi:hypothetical protein